MERTQQKPITEAPPASKAHNRAALVARALGLPTNWKPDEHLGETLHFLTVWTQHELNRLYIRVGGTVTHQLVTRTSDDGATTWPATEITLTVHVPNVGDVQIVTDWDADSGGTDLPIMRHIPAAELIA
ncbi:hypothetical protein ABT127_29625 [Streptomyces sp. NPDC001904]|uniref:hypothetical protein n=1 Tax=Streptomyces sp. NPDC001904 TaxID=3154531 RepID=UPI0033308B27